MKKIFIFLFLFLFVGGAFAAGDNVTTSKSYVDAEIAQKQEIIPANSGTTQVIINTGTDGEIGTKDIYNSSNSYTGQSGALIDAATMNAAVQNAIDSEFECVDDDCELVNISGTNVRKSPNLFDVSKIPTRLSSSDTQIINNGDGSITVTASAGNSAITTNRRLSILAPELVAGKTYTLSFDTTGTNKSTYFYCYGHTGDNFYWQQNTAKTITNEMLGCYMYFYASGDRTTATIKNIQITEGTDVKPYVDYGNIYMPVGQ